MSTQVAQKTGVRIQAPFMLFGESALAKAQAESVGLEKLSKREAMVKNCRRYRQQQAIDKRPKRHQDALLRSLDAFLSRAGSRSRGP
ncbi:MAG: hypothetical protein HYZ17_08600 [Betaproteobacteria bacterium]|nr:hypothetical protein [Betaproteobacteria bacterium]